MAMARGSYKGGASGPFRRRSFRRAAMVYERQASALRNSVQSGKSGWLSKILDPASRIITRSTRRFFTSVFRKSLPALDMVSGIYGAMALVGRLICSITEIDCLGGFNPTQDAILEGLGYAAPPIMALLYM